MSRILPNVWVPGLSLVAAAGGIVLGSATAGATVGWLPGTLTFLGELAATAISAVGFNVWSSQITNFDPRLNNSIEAASGRAIVAVLARWRDANLQHGKNVDRLVAVVRKAHDPKWLAKAGPAELPPFDAAGFLANPDGFLRKAAMSADAWADYLRTLAKRRRLEIAAFADTIDRLAARLEEEHATAFLHELQQDQRGDAFRGALLRQVQVLIHGVTGLREDNDTTHRLLRQIRDGFGKRLDTALQELGDGNAQLVAEVRSALLTLGNCFHRLDAKVDEIRDGVVRIEHAIGTHAKPRLFHSTIPMAPHQGVLGRDGQLARMRTLLGYPAVGGVAVVHGGSGNGKSEFAFEFGRRNWGLYPGGTFAIDARDGALAAGLADLGARLGFGLEGSIPDQAVGTLVRLGGGPPTLLVYDNVTSFDAIAPLLPGANCGVSVILTTVLEPSSRNWPAIELLPCSEAATLDVIRAIDERVASAHGASLFHGSGGVPVQFVGKARELKNRMQKGLSVAVGGLTSEALQSGADALRDLRDDGRLLLGAVSFHNGRPIARDEIAQLLQRVEAWSFQRFEAAIQDAASHGFELGTDPTSFRLHQVRCQQVREAPVGKGRAAVDSMRASQVERLLELADALAENPNQPQVARILLGFPATVDELARNQVVLDADQGARIGRALFVLGQFSEAQRFFEHSVAVMRMGAADGMGDQEGLGNSLHEVGRCMTEMRRYDEALPYFLQAVDVKERGDREGRVDRQSLGKSLHMVGYCHAELDRFGEAIPLFEQAVKATRDGNMGHIVDHGELGKSMHMVGYCHSQSSRYDDAIPHFRDAVIAKRLGDPHGRVDQQSLGASLHMLGRCHLESNRYEAALPYFEEAAAAKEQGDVHQRIDHESLGVSLQQAGCCHSKMGRHEKALTFFEQAVKEARQGDVHRRVDFESLAAALEALGKTLVELRRPEEAVVALSEAATLRAKAIG